MINKQNCNKDVLFMLSKPRSQMNIETTEKKLINVRIAFYSIQDV